MEEKENRILEEIKRHNSVLMEHMEQQVKTVAEQHGSIMAKLEEHDRQLAQLPAIQSELGTVKMAVLENGRQIKVNSNLIKANSSQIKVNSNLIKANSSQIKANGNLIKNNSNQIEDLKTGQERIETKLDTKLTDHEIRIGQLEGKVA